jgi:hypothetical protein
MPASMAEAARRAQGEAAHGIPIRSRPPARPQIGLSNVCNLKLNKCAMKSPYSLASIHTPL